MTERTGSEAPASDHDEQTAPTEEARPLDGRAPGDSSAESEPLDLDAARALRGNEVPF